MSGQIYVKASTTATLAFASFVTITVQTQAEVLVNDDPNGDGPGNGDFAFHLQLAASLQISFLNGARGRERGSLSAYMGADLALANQLPCQLQASLSSPRWSKRPICTSAINRKPTSLLGPPFLQL